LTRFNREAAARVWANAPLNLGQGAIRAADFVRTLPELGMLEHGTRLHFLGIGGIGVSAVARVAIERGYLVSGSDVRRSQLTDTMQALGATVFIGQRPENLDGAQVVVVSTAIPATNPELVAARERGLPVLHRSELLAELLSERLSIGVTGTHGKGTTSAMITRMLDAAGREPGFIIGGLLLDYGINARGGQGDVMVAEVDESDGSHANIPTDLLLCNFIEPDHLNYYRDHEDIIASMARVFESNPRLKQGFVNVDCEGNRELLRRITRPVTTYGVEQPADYRAELLGQGQLPLRFRVTRRGELLGDFELPLPGRYNVVNAVGAIAVCDFAGVPVEAMQRGLAAFRGLENRFTIVDAAGLFLVKDYNSHPTAIRKVLESARDLATGRIVSVFKPYRYTLTSYLQNEYAEAFDGSDEVVITTMYAANEDPIPGVDTEFVVRRLRDRGLTVTHIPDQEQVIGHLEATTRPGDKVLFFGGDDFFRMADAWAARRRAALPTPTPPKD
jgi:UDP-N-acetylmuramate--alanine ligase